MVWVDVNEKPQLRLNYELFFILRWLLTVLLSTGSCIVLFSKLFSPTSVDIGDIFNYQVRKLSSLT